MRRWAFGLVALAGLAVTGCGFTPVYGDGGGVGANLSRIAVTTQDDRLGYRLREQLEDALGRDGALAPQWRLEATAKQSRRPLGRRPDDTAVRYELTVKADWTLISIGAGDPPGAPPGAPMTGTETVTVTYSAADQPYAAIAAQQDGEERAAAELARLIRLDLMRTMASQP